jgi:hypothetical protein
MCHVHKEILAFLTKGLKGSEYRMSMCSSLKHYEQARNIRLCLEYLLQNSSTLSPCSVSFTQEGVERGFGWLGDLTFSYTFNNMPLVSVVFVFFLNMPDNL